MFALPDRAENCGELLFRDLTILVLVEVLDELLCFFLEFSIDLT